MQRYLDVEFYNQFFKSAVDIKHRFGCRHGAVGSRGDKLANVLDAIVACHKNALCFGAAILRRDRIACAVQLDQGRKGLILGDPAHGDKQSADLQGAHIALLVGHFDALQTLVGVELGDFASVEALEEEMLSI